MSPIPIQPKYKARPLIVGESNPYGGNDDYALYPAPDGCSGHRLCCLILQMRRSVYLGRFDRCNLVQGRWSIKKARVRASKLRGRYCILLGAKVCSAFDIPFHPFESQFPSTDDGGGGLLVLPHPSGLCRLWNEEGAFTNARKSVAKFCPELAEYIGIVHSLRSGL